MLVRYTEYTECTFKVSGENRIWPNRIWNISQHPLLWGGESGDRLISKSRQRRLELRARMHFWQYETAWYMIFRFVWLLNQMSWEAIFFKSSANLKMTHRSLKDHFIGSLKKSAYKINGLAITNVLSKPSKSRKRNYLQMIQRYFANELWPSSW